MQAIQQTIGRARVRVFLQDFMDGLAASTLAMLLAATLLLIADRLLSLSLHWGFYAALAGAVLAAAPVIAWLRRPDDNKVATLIDQRLHLKDQLATALYAQRMTNDPFAQQVIRDAHRTAENIDLKEAFRLRAHRAWGWTAPVAALLALLAVFLVPMDLLGRESARQQAAAEEQEAAAVEQQLVQAVAAVRELRDTSRDSSEMQEASDELRELAGLTRQELKNPEMRRQAMAKLSSVQDKLGQAADQQEAQFNTVQAMLSRLDVNEKGPADKFADALRRGDFEAAAQALDDLAKEVESMSPEDRAAMERQLNSLADQLNQAAQQAAQQQAQQQQQTQQTLQNAGLSQQQIQQLQQQNFNPQAVQQALQQNGMSPQQAQQTAQQVQQQQQQQKNSGQCGSCASGLASSLGQMSRNSSSGQGKQGQSNQQGQQQGGQQSFSQAAGQAGSQLSQMAQMQNALQQMRQAQGSSGASGSKNSNPFQQSQIPSGGGVGGSKAGTGSGGNPLGNKETQLTGYQTEAKGDIGEGQGKVIASWMEYGEMAKGDANVSFDQAVTEAKHDAEQAITDDRVPRRYHEAVREYFNQLPDTPAKVAPRAPR